MNRIFPLDMLVKSTNAAAKNTETVTAFAGASKSQHTLVPAFCGEIPVLVDMQSRAVYPVKNA